MSRIYNCFNRSHTIKAKVKKYLSCLHKTLAAMIVFIFFISTPMYANAIDMFTINKSKAMEALLWQAEQSYMQPKNLTLQGDNDGHDLISVAMVLGFSMQGQLRHKQQNPQYAAQFKELKNEAQFFLQQLAMLSDNPTNLRNGKSIDGNLLVDYFNKAMNGNLNKAITLGTGINPAQVKHAFILNQVATNQTNGHIEPSGKFIIEETNEINLLNQIAGPAESQFDITPSTKKAPPADAIVGEWYDSTNKNRRMTIHKKNGHYVAVEYYYDEASYKKYKLTTTYTFYPSKEPQKSIWRWYTVKRQYVCEPQVRTYECRNPISETNITLSHMPEEGYYFIGTNAQGIFSGWRKNI